MMTREFEQYLEKRFPGPKKKGSRDNAKSRCRRVEKYEGDLDEHYEADGMLGLLNKLEYTVEDESYNRPPRHSIPIKGSKKSSMREGTASLKDAVKVYCDFRNGSIPEAGSRQPGADAGSPSGKKAKTTPWPKWEQPNSEDLKALMGITARHVRFLNPAIVAAIVEDNARNDAEWRETFDAKGIDSDVYLWSGSACAFPGVRRHSGNAEIAAFRNRDFGGLLDAIALDDNSYPKQVWAFLFTGKKFANFGPDGYRLAHLLDHKGGKRFSEEVICPHVAVNPIPGLYTAASNSAYVCDALIDPTDTNATIRRAIQRHAYELYGNICELLPPGYELSPDNEALDLANSLVWADPVGDVGNIGIFLEWRKAELNRLCKHDDSLLGVMP